jgi:hypothetical protein
MFKVATDSQRAYLGSLIAKSGSSIVLSATLSISEASALIEQLKATAVTTATSTELVPEGIYRRSSDGLMFRVQTSETGRRYAKTLLETGGWGYERGAVFTLKASERLTLDQVKSWGLDTGVCAVCGRLLSTADSVAAGIGPVCARRY